MVRPRQTLYYSPLEAPNRNRRHRRRVRSRGRACRRSDTHAFRHDAGRRGRRRRHADGGPRHQRADHHLRCDAAGAAAAGQDGPLGRRGARLRRSGGLRRQAAVLRRHRRAVREPHRRREIHARRQDVFAGREQRAERAARRHQGLRQSRLDDGRSEERPDRERDAHLHEPRRRRRLPRHAQSQRHLQPRRQPHAHDELRSDDRQADDRQSHEPQPISIWRACRPRAAFSITGSWSTQTHTHRSTPR